MADVNWGLLQSLQSMAPIHTSAPQGGGGIISPPSGGSIDPYAQQKMQMQQEQLDMEKARQAGTLKNTDLTNQQLQQAIDQNNKLAPGQLQGQQLTNTQTGLINQTKQAELDAAKLQMAQHQQVAQAFITGQKSGGTEGGLDAMGQTMLEQGNVEGYQKFEENRAALKKTKQEIGNGGIVNVGFAIGNLPNLKAYADAYDTLKKAAPDLPKPETFKNDSDYQTHLQVPAVAMAGPLAAQQKADIEAQKNNKLYEAQQVRKRTINEYQNAVDSYGINSPQAKRAKQAVQEANTESQVATGVGTGITGSIKSLIPDKTDYSDIEGSQQGNQEPGKSAPSSTPTGAPNYSLEDINKEIARKEALLQQNTPK